jgi:hypothetical protein
MNMQFGWARWCTKLNISQKYKFNKHEIVSHICFTVEFIKLLQMEKHIYVNYNEKYKSLFLFDASNTPKNALCSGVDGIWDLLVCHCCDRFHVVYGSGKFITKMEHVTYIRIST